MPKSVANKFKVLNGAAWRKWFRAAMEESGLSISKVVELTGYSRTSVVTWRLYTKKAPYRRTQEHVRQVMEQVIKERRERLAN